MMSAGANLAVRIPREWVRKDAKLRGTGNTGGG
jgi:hypothetical protein